MTALEAPEAGHVGLERDGAIGWIIMDHPARHNALTTTMWRSLPALIGGAEADSAVRVIVLRGAGDKVFSAGAGISKFDTVREGGRPASTTL
jgi:enoyl-CoA hydratase